MPFSLQSAIVLPFDFFRNSGRYGYKYYYPVLHVKKWKLKVIIITCPIKDRA